MGKLGGRGRTVLANEWYCEQSPSCSAATCAQSSCAGCSIWQQTISNAMRQTEQVWEDAVEQLPTKCQELGFCIREPCQSGTTAPFRTKKREQLLSWHRCSRSQKTREFGCQERQQPHIIPPSVQYYWIWLHHHLVLPNTNLECRVETAAHLLDSIHQASHDSPPRPRLWAGCCGFSHVECANWSTGPMQLALQRVHHPVNLIDQCRRSSEELQHLSRVLECFFSTDFRKRLCASFTSDAHSTQKSPHSSGRSGSNNRGGLLPCQLGDTQEQLLNALWRSANGAALSSRMLQSVQKLRSDSRLAGKIKSKNRNPQAGVAKTGAELISREGQEAGRDDSDEKSRRRG